MMAIKFVKSVSYKGLMASNGNVLGVICRCSTKFKICADTNKSRKEVSHKLLGNKKDNILFIRTILAIRNTTTKES
jgi:hypothetical protein